MEQFLQDIVLFINETRGAQRNDILWPTADRIAAYYRKEMKNGGELLDSLRAAFGEDLELYFLVLSTIDYIVEDPACLQEIETLLLRPDLDLFVANNVWFQLSQIYFRRDALRQSYTRWREINSFLLERYEREYPLTVPFLPYEERNKKRIVIETDTFLNVLHAPTRLILELCRVLIRDLGYDVFLLVNSANMELGWMESFWLFPYSAVHLPDLKGRFSYSYEEIEIKGYAMFWGRESIAERDWLIKEIQEWKPLCIWHIGSVSFRHDIYRQITTVLSMPCTDGYSISEAPVLVSYMQSNSAFVKESIDYTEQSGQKRLSIEVATEHKELGKNYTKPDLGFPEDAFVVSIVGTRLSQEMSVDFIEMLREVADASARICFMIVGICHEELFQLPDAGRVQYLGYREDLVDVIKVSDLFVNPPRQGGGGGVVRAFSVGVPAVTLPGCDVANMTGEDFYVQDLGEMKEEILKYASDSTYYAAQQEKVKQRHAKRMSVDTAKSYEAMLRQLEEWLQKGEVR